MVKVRRPTFVTIPTGNEFIFPSFYRNMEACLKKAVDAIDLAEPLVEEQRRLAFNSEASMARWFYHVVRTQANFYDAFLLRRAIGELLERTENGVSLTDTDRDEAMNKVTQWREILQDELENAKEALPVMEADMRLDFRYFGYCPGSQMIRAKMAILEKEIAEYLPSVAERLGR